MSDDMNREIESRLRRLGRADVPSLDETRVDAIAQQILAKPHAARRTSWITAAAAACVVLALGITLALRDDGQNSLHPSTPTETLVETTPPEPETTLTVSSSVVPPTTRARPCRRAGFSIPPASFALTVERVGNELQFSWPQYSGADARRYVLIRIDADRLTNWPVSESRIAVTTTDLSTTNASVTLRAQPRRRWVLAVIGENRRLIAVSTVAVSD